MNQFAPRFAQIHIGMTITSFPFFSWAKNENHRVAHAYSVLNSFFAIVNIFPAVEKLEIQLTEKVAHRLHAYCTAATILRSRSGE